MNTLNTLSHDVDELAECVSEQMRGVWALDKSVAVISNLADYGLIWALIGAARATTSRRLRQKSLRAVLFTAIASPALNWSLKFIVRRPRPYQSDLPSYSPADLQIAPHALAQHLSRLTSFETRTPQSPSFPSGHALTAWCAATTLAADDPLGPAYYLLATAISYSRLHLGHHYATDVIGGAVLGAALGNAGRQWIQGHQLPLS